MSANKDKNTRTWTCQFYYNDYNGKRKKKFKRGFATKKAALAWESEYLLSKQADMTMKFGTFIELYFEDMSHRLRESTLKSKQYMVNDKLLPYFKDFPMCEIKPTDIRRWQNHMMSYERENGKKYSQTYLKTLNNQVCSIFNYAVRFYGLKENPCHKAGTMGKKHAEEMKFWTPNEFNQFIKVCEDDILNTTLFTTLYLTGVRIGELLALTKQDIDFEAKTININKSLQRLNKKDIITDPKTPKSNRTITIPNFVCDCLKKYMDHLYDTDEEMRLFKIYKSSVGRRLKVNAEKVGVKTIRVHDLRHSHASLLIEMGFGPLLIVERLGHEKVQTPLDTYGYLYPNKQQEVSKQLDEMFTINI